MDLAKKYINYNSISVSALCYISNPTQTSESEKKDNAQYFHYDNDFKKFFKVFIYLSDVSLAAGLILLYLKLIQEKNLNT